MWYLTLLAFGVAAVGAWFFFKKATPDVTLDVNKDKVTDADARAAVTAVVEQVKVIAAEKAKPEPAPVAPPAPVVVETKTKKKAAAPKALAAPVKKATKRVKK
jgi:hypothetical protein